MRRTSDIEVLRVDRTKKTPIKNIEDICIFQCKIDFLFHRMNAKSSIFTSGEDTSKNITFGVHE